VKNLKVGDRVTMAPMWKHRYARGEVIKITKEYIVVRWDNINGEWHYTQDQSQSLFHENLPEDEKLMWETWGDK